MRKPFIILIFILAFCLLPKIAAAGIIIRPVFNSGLVGYWSFNEGTGTKAGDFSGNGNNGTWDGSGAYWTDGKVGKGGIFNGSDDYVTLSSNPITSMTSSNTICAWIQTNDNTYTYGGYSQTILNFYTDANNGVRIVNDDTGLAGSIYVGYVANSTDYSRDTSAVQLTNGVWKNFCAVFDGSALTIYVNGSSVALTTVGAVSRGAVNMIGARDATGGNWRGLIDEVRIYNRVLETSEIQRLYNSGLAKVGTNRLGLVPDDLPSNATISYVRENCTGYSPCYHSLFDWEAAGGGFDYADHSCAVGNLTCLDKTAVAKIDGTWASPDPDGIIQGNVSIDGWTTDATRYIKIYTTATARHPGKWDDTKYRLEVADDIPITINEEYTRIDGLQIKLTTTTNYLRAIYGTVNNASSDVRISDNIIWGVCSAPLNDCTGIMTAYNNTANYRIWNNIVYDVDRGIMPSQYATAQVYNNTVVNCDNGYYGNGAPVIIAKNNIAYNNTDNYYVDGEFDDYSTNNLSGPSSDAEMPPTNARNGVTVNFVDATNRDFHLAPSDTNARNYGTNLSGSGASVSFSTDIDRQSRAGTWDIGADEVLVSKIGASQKDQISNGLVGYWSFNGPDMESATAFDRSGQGNDGTITGASIINGKVGQALNFDGTDDTVITASFRASLNITGPITISVWIYPHSLTPLGYIGFVQKTNFSSSYYLGTGNNKTDISFYYGGTQVALTASNVLKLNQWQHVAVSYSSTGTDIYWNGTSAIHSDTIATPAGNNGSLEIGYRDDTSRWFDGIIDEVRIYNRALSADEVLRLYNLGR